MRPNNPPSIPGRMETHARLSKPPFLLLPSSRAVSVGGMGHNPRRRIAIHHLSPSSTARNPFAKYVNPFIAWLPLSVFFLWVLWYLRYCLGTFFPPSRLRRMLWTE